MTQKSYCIIMAGGVGHRLWPLSNARHPKQFTDIFNTGKTCIRQTYERIANIFPPERIFIITRKEFREITRKEISEIPVENILLEPCNRNTATCIAYAAYKIEGIAPNAVMLIIPSDHFITNDIAYIEDIEEGIEFVARNTGLLTIGIKPTRPETAYGYIQEKNSSGKEKNHRSQDFYRETQSRNSRNVYQIRRFSLEFRHFHMENPRCDRRIQKNICTTSISCSRPTLC